MTVSGASPLRRGLRGINNALAVAAAACILMMMLVGAVDIIGTWLFRQPVPGAYEITEAFMVSGIFLALAAAQMLGHHIRAEIFRPVLPIRVSHALDRVGFFVMFVFFAFVTWYGWLEAADAWRGGEFASGILKMPVWPPKLALAIGATAMAVQSLADAFLGRDSAPKGGAR
jgi:TRAP-type C4-dicarboxylate transport system permease small subunit